MACAVFVQAQEPDPEDGSNAFPSGIPERTIPKNSKSLLERASGVSFTTGYDPALFETLLEGANCFEIKSMSLSAVNSAVQVGTFHKAKDAGFDIDEGIVLTTGVVAEVFTTNSSTGITNGTFNAAAINDADLDAISSSGMGTHDEAILEIQFDIPIGINGFGIPFQFAGDEYPEYVCSDFNDVFAVFIDGPGLGGFQRISLVPGTSNPISVNNLNGGTCGTFSSGQPADLGQAALFIDNNDGTPGGPLLSEFDGFTVMLSAVQGGLSTGTYTVKLAIGDLGDHRWDSGVFFGAMQAFSGGNQVNCTCISNPLSDPAGDCDNDGTPNGNETDAAAALNPCTPDPLAIGTGDCDNDGTLNQNEVDAIAAMDPCDPDPLGLNIGDCDNDGIANQKETDTAAALDSCDPDPKAIPTGDCDSDNILNQNDDCPLVFGVAPHGCPDNDIDGYPDDSDLDDDNDGILDMDEMNCPDPARFNSLTFSGTAISSATETSITGANTGWKSSYSDQVFELPIHFEFNLPTTNGRAMIGLIPEGATQTLSGWNDAGYKWYFRNNKLYGKLPFNWNPNNVTVQANETYEIDIDATGLVTCRRNGVVIRSFAGAQSDYRLVFTSRKTRVFNQMVLTAANYGGTCTDQDTDGDGTPDHFDRDSDEDGCFDALEGSGRALSI